MKSCRLLIRFQQRIYRLFTYWLADSDGSFYITLPREGTTDIHWHGVINPRDGIAEWSRGESTPKPKTKRISYHASGMVVYHGNETPHIYCEPIYGITKPFRFGTHSVPSIDRLDVYNKQLRASDTVIDAPDNAIGRINFGCTIAPWDWISPAHLGISIRYDELFSFHVSIEENSFIVPPEFSNYFSCFVPGASLFDKAMVDNDTALLNFHHKKEGTKDFIGYFNQGVYTLIFRVPMACVPKFSIRFEDPSLRADVLQLRRTWVRFRVVDACGRLIKKEQIITSIILEANP